jgi:hypothetical protein
MVKELLGYYTTQHAAYAKRFESNASLLPEPLPLSAQETA